MKCCKVQPLTWIWCSGCCTEEPPCSRLIQAARTSTELRPHRLHQLPWLREPLKSWALGQPTLSMHGSACLPFKRPCKQKELHSIPGSHPQCTFPRMATYQASEAKARGLRQQRHGLLSQTKLLRAQCTGRSDSISCWLSSP